VITTIFATTVKLKIVGSEMVNVVLLGPFFNFQDLLQAITPSIRGWSRGLKKDSYGEEISVTIEFNYGDFVYRDIHYLYPSDKGGADTTLQWLDFGVHDWLADRVLTSKPIQKPERNGFE